MLEWIENLELGELNALSVTVRVVLAMLCSGILGIERTKKRRPAGLRTYMLVCVGSAVVMMTGLYIFGSTGAGDPTRMAAQVVSGIGFIGAGTIIFTRYKQVKGLTTAAGIWASACMGIAIGGGFYIGALITCAALLFIMIFADRFESRYSHRLRLLHCYAVLEDIAAVKAFLKRLRVEKIRVFDVEIKDATDTMPGITVYASLSYPEKKSQDEMLAYVSDFDGVLFVEKI